MVSVVCVVRDELHRSSSTSSYSSGDSSNNDSQLQITQKLKSNTYTLKTESLTEAESLATPRLAVIYREMWRIRSVVDLSKTRIKELK